MTFVLAMAIGGTAVMTFLLENRANHEKLP